MARDRDRSPEAVARAFLIKARWVCWSEDTVRDLVPLIRAIRQECARVVRQPCTCDRPGCEAARHSAAVDILALNRAPKKEARRG